ASPAPPPPPLSPTAAATAEGGGCVGVDGVVLGGGVPEGFWYSHTIPETERTRALATIQHSAAAETTSAAAKTTSAAAKTTSAAAETSAAAAAPSTPITGPSTAPAQLDDTPPTSAQQLNPTPREVHHSANFTASFYSNSDLYRPHQLMHHLRKCTATSCTITNLDKEHTATPSRSSMPLRVTFGILIFQARTWLSRSSSLGFQ
ncbi:unnamed protein product, partial [Closterium sp. NIES-54]